MLSLSKPRRLPPTRIASTYLESRRGKISWREMATIKTREGSFCRCKLRTNPVHRGRAFHPLDRDRNSRNPWRVSVKGEKWGTSDFERLCTTRRRFVTDNE